MADSQESERMRLYDIISTSKDDELVKWAQNRLRELDRNQEEAQNQHDLFLKDERETSNKNIVGMFLCVLAGWGFVVSNKQIRQAAKNTLHLLFKNDLFVDIQAVNQGLHRRNRNWHITILQKWRE